MSSQLFPKFRGLTWDVELTPTFSTDIQQALAGREVRTAKWANPIWQIKLTYAYLPHDPNKPLNDSGYTDLETLMGFYLSRQGSFDDFLLNLSDVTQRLEDSVYSGQALGVGDAVTTKFQLTRSFGGFSEAVQNPAGQSAIVYVNGVAKVQGTDYTIANGIVTFSAAPANGANLTADFTMLYRVRFDNQDSTGNSSGASDGLNFNNFYYLLWECKEVDLISVIV
jgi:uncharacterized protein (TIGR02217 family)